MSLSLFILFILHCTLYTNVIILFYLAVALIIITTKEANIEPIPIKFITFTAIIVISTSHAQYTNKRQILIEYSRMCALPMHHISLINILKLQNFNVWIGLGFRCCFSLEFEYDSDWIMETASNTDTQTHRESWWRIFF